MITDLKGLWEMSDEDGNVYKSEVPGTVLKTLLDNKVIDDPYYRLNEKSAQPYLGKNYSFKRKFNLPLSALLAANYLLIDGIDTIANLYINDHLIGTCEDMHLSYSFLINNLYLKEGENEIRVDITSANNYLNDNCEKSELFYGFSDTSDNRYPKIRKAHFSFGWDWGPTLPDMGIYKGIKIISTTLGYIDSFNHQVLFSSGKAFVNISCELSLINIINSTLSVSIYDNDQLIDTKTIKPKKSNTVSLIINDPKKWYPAGYGDQPLYTVKIEFKDSNESCEKTFKIGLREVQVKDKKDEYGRELTINVNGIDIFVKGSNYIPMDSIYPNVTKEKTERLLKLVKDFNHNTVRVWGGGYIPEDYFYDYCDENGIMVFEDLMFACAIYDFDDSHFSNLVQKEVQDILKKIRHHASIILISGNNECEVAIASWNPPKKEESEISYRKLFLDLIPAVVKKESDFYYLSSSPTSGDPYFLNPSSSDYLDMHLWQVWHGMEPISFYQTVYPRFLSEFGLQSFPSVNCIKEYAIEEDMRIDSEVMLQHQKNKKGNEKIYKYIKDSYKDPKDFTSLVYLSQISQAMALKCAVEHLRINSKRCMGALYWQLNDCWGVQSWSSIDYYFNLKPLHYESKKFFANTLVTFEKKEGVLGLYAVSEKNSIEPYHVVLDLYNLSGKKILEKTYDINLSPLSPLFIESLESNKYNGKDFYYKAFIYSSKDNLLGENYYFFKNYKDIKLKKPRIKMKQLDSRTLEISANHLSLNCFLTTSSPSIIFEENNFNLKKNEIKRIKVSCDFNIKDVNVMSLYDSYK